MYSAPGYGELSAGAVEAITLAARTEGVILDPVYTGKAMAGLIDHIRRGRLGPSDTVCFIHTGGVPALFAYKDELLAFLLGTHDLPDVGWYGVCHRAWGRDKRFEDSRSDAEANRTLDGCTRGGEHCAMAQRILCV